MSPSSSPRPWLLLGWLILVGCGEPEPQEPVAGVGLGFAEAELPYPEWRSLRLTWRPEADLDLEGAPSVFLHLVDQEGDLVRTFDHPFPAPWKIGEEVQYEVEIYQSALGDPLAPGDYELVLGLYGADNRRWPLTVEGAEERPRTEYRVAAVSVPPVSAEAPAFEFPAPWQPLEPGSDRQVLGRRWLQGSGSIQVLNLEVPGTVKLRATVPGGGGDTGGWQLRPGEEIPVLEISSTCSGTVRSLEVPGSFDVVLPVFPASEDLTCEIRFLTNYDLVDGASQGGQTLALEILAWTAAQL